MKTYTIPVPDNASLTIEYNYDDDYSYHIHDYDFNDHITIWAFNEHNKIIFKKTTETLDEAIQLIQEHIKERQTQ